MSGERERLKERRKRWKQTVDMLTREVVLVMVDWFVNSSVVNSSVVSQAETVPSKRTFRKDLFPQQQHPQHQQLALLSSIPLAAPTAVLLNTGVTGSTFVGTVCLFHLTLFIVVCTNLFISCLAIWRVFVHRRTRERRNHSSGR